MTLTLNNTSQTLGGLDSEISGIGNLFINLADDHALTVNQAADGTFLGAISGTGASLQKTGDATLTLEGANTYTGATTVTAGTLEVNGSIASSSGVTVEAGAFLSGTGSVGALGGAGQINPGNSPGILTAATVDFSGGMDFAFEFTATGAPDWNTAGASVNDVLRVTDDTDPFVGTTASASNGFDIYLGVATISNNDAFVGGLFSELTLAGITANGTYNYFVLGDGSGSNNYDGTGYFTLAEYNAANTTSWSIVQSFVPVTGANFESGTVNGFSQQFTVIPEPGSALLLGLGLLAMGIRRRR